MKSTKHSLKIGLAAAVAAAFVMAAVAGAQPSILRGGEVTKVRIAIWDPATSIEIGQLGPGDTLVLDAGDSVVLRLFTPRGYGPGDRRQYLAGTLSVKAGAGVELTDVDTENGSAVLKARPSRGVAEILYALKAGSVKTTMEVARNTFSVDVQALSKGQRVVRSLYLGILLRDVDYDSPRLKNRIEEIDRVGYAAVVEAAKEIATSEESRSKVYERGHDNRERLASIYQHLLDLEPEEFDTYQMQDHLRMMERRDVVGVVMDIVRSAEFRRVHRYNR